MRPVIVRAEETKDHKQGFRIKINSEEATVQDYLDAVNDFIERGTLTRAWGKVDRCEGCHLCCHEPAPVTLQDVLKLGEGLKISFTDVFRFLRVEEMDGGVDITLARRRGDACVFLREDGRCKVYRHRPFVCQTYICCPPDRDNEDLRSAIVNQGEDALVREALLKFRESGQAMPIARGRSKIRLSAWPPNKFSAARDYRTLVLKDILPKGLYRRLKAGN